MGQTDSEPTRLECQTKLESAKLTVKLAGRAFERHQVGAIVSSRGVEHQAVAQVSDFSFGSGLHRGTSGAAMYLLL